MATLLLAIIYASFISLGLPDAVLGAAWPVMHRDMGVAVSMAGLVSITVSCFTIASSLLSDRMNKKFGTGPVTAVSVGMTAVALFGFSLSTEYWMLLLWAIPYGLGAGSVDAALNNYVAVHYASRHMSWLHCMWGIGASAGPSILGFVLAGGLHWSRGYQLIGLLQAALTVILFFSLRLWKQNVTEAAPKFPQKALSYRQILAIPGTKEVFLAFFCYCALEQTAILWGSTYMVAHLGLAEERAASLGSLFLLGITLGRAVTGFLTYKLSDAGLIRLGCGFLAVGVVALLLPFWEGFAMAGFFLMGLGCAPIYPCIIHSTPEHFGAENSQAIMGVQMASAYVGSLLMPPLFGLVANHISVSLLPVFLGCFLALMFSMHERLQRQ